MDEGGLIGEAPGEAIGTTRGAEAVAGQVLSSQLFARHARPALIDGAAGLVTVSGGRPTAVMSFVIVDGRVAAIDVSADPERLAQLDLTILGDAES